MIGQIEVAEKSGEKSIQKKQLFTTDNEFDRDNEEDSDKSVKAPQKNNKVRCLHDTEEDDDDEGEEKSKNTKRKRLFKIDTNVVKAKKQKMSKQINSEFSER